MRFRVFSNKEEIEESIKRLQNETTSYIQEMVQEKKYLPRFMMWHDFNHIAKGSKIIEEDPFQDNISNIVEVFLPNESLRDKLKQIHKERKKEQVYTMHIHTVQEKEGQTKIIID